MSSPRVSVLLCVFDGAEHLGAAIESILGQTFTALELIVIDDGSRDASGAIAERYARSDPRVRVVHQENRGLTRALNTGLRLARGELLARQDADDVSRADRLAAQVAFLDRHPEHLLVGSRYRKIDGAGRIVGRSRPPLGNAGLQLRLLSRNGIGHSTACFRLAPVLELGGYDESFRVAQDYDLWCRLARRGRIANLRPWLVSRRQHPGQIGVRSATDQEQARDRIRRAHCETLVRRGAPGVFGTLLVAAAALELLRRGPR